MERKKGTIAAKTTENNNPIAKIGVASCETAPYTYPSGLALDLGSCTLSAGLISSPLYLAVGAMKD